MCRWDAPMLADVLGPKCAAAVDGDGAAHWTGSHRDGHLDRVVALTANLPQRRRVHAAKNRALTTGQHRSHPPAVLGELGAPDRVDATPDRVQPPLGDPVLDRLWAETERTEMRVSHHAV